ncbi:MAG: aminopeptidase P family protein [Anaerolineae bacterium]|nr:aminopeptidase P family protein [Anaerolineae bacterium]
MLTRISIPPAEFATRRARLGEYVQSQGLSGVVLFDSYYILYFANFAFIPTERPMAFVMNAEGQAGMFVPRLEAEHARAKTGFDRVDHYLEYPGETHAIQYLKTMLQDMGITGRIGADTDGYPWILGYRGPSLTELMGATVVPVTGYVEDLMMIKSPSEIALIKESVKWGHLAHRLLQKYTQVGVTETEVSQRASMEANAIMLETLGPIYAAQSMSTRGASAGYRGQIGRNAAIPHALANNMVFQPGDVLVTGAAAPMWGYLSELERTMFVGPPNARQREMFEHMKALQETAFEAMRPGVKCSDVDRAVRRYYDEHDLIPYWKHHSGHAIGLRYHEGPFLDTGDPTELKPGMVFTVEPGLYAADLGGFRHSDTVLITDDGIEILTYYPRDLESLIIPV